MQPDNISTRQAASCLNQHYQAVTGMTPQQDLNAMQEVLKTFQAQTPPDLIDKLEELTLKEGYLVSFVKKERTVKEKGLSFSSLFFFVCYLMRHHRNTLFQRWPLDKKPLYTIATVMGISTARY